MHTHNIRRCKYSLFTTLLQIFPDNACQREILHLEVYCNYMTRGCLWIGPLKDLDVNLLHISQLMLLQCVMSGIYIYEAKLGHSKFTSKHLWYKTSRASTSQFKCSPGSHSQLVSYSVGIMSSCLLLALPLLVSLMSMLPLLLEWYLELVTVLDYSLC